MTEPTGLFSILEWISQLHNSWIGFFFFLLELKIKTLNENIVQYQKTMLLLIYLINLFISF